MRRTTWALPGEVLACAQADEARMLEVVFTRDVAETRILTAYWQDLAS
jgi:hypothetical protein